MKRIGFWVRSVLVAGALMTTAAVANADIPDGRSRPELYLAPDIEPATRQIPIGPIETQFGPVVDLQHVYGPTFTVPDLERELMWANGPFGWRVPVMTLFRF